LTGGVWTVASFGLRVFNRAHREVSKVVADKKEYIPSSLATPPTGAQNGGQYFGYHDGNGQGRSSGMGGTRSLSFGSDLKGR
jgi:hypothetical protein